MYINLLKNTPDLFRDKKIISETLKTGQTANLNIEPTPSRKVSNKPKL